MDEKKKVATAAVVAAAATTTTTALTVPSSPLSINTPSSRSRIVNPMTPRKKREHGTVFMAACSGEDDVCANLEKSFDEAQTKTQTKSALNREQLRENGTKIYENDSNNGFDKEQQLYFVNSSQHKNRVLNPRANDPVEIDGFSYINDNEQFQTFKSQSRNCFKPSNKEELAPKPPVKKTKKLNVTPSKDKRDLVAALKEGTEVKVKVSITETYTGSLLKKAVFKKMKQLDTKVGKYVERNKRLWSESEEKDDNETDNDITSIVGMATLSLHNEYMNKQEIKKLVGNLLWDNSGEIPNLWRLHKAGCFRIFLLPYEYRPNYNLHQLIIQQSDLQTEKFNLELKKMETERDLNLKKMDTEKDLKLKEMDLKLKEMENDILKWKMACAVLVVIILANAGVL